MNLRRTIYWLITAVVVLAVVVLALVSGLSWFMMGKRTTTQVRSQPAMVDSSRVRAFRTTLK